MIIVYLYILFLTKTAQCYIVHLFPNNFLVSFQSDQMLLYLYYTRNNTYLTIHHHYIKQLFDVNQSKASPQIFTFSPSVNAIFFQSDQMLLNINIIHEATPKLLITIILISILTATARQTLQIFTFNPSVKSTLLGNSDVQRLDRSEIAYTVIMFSLVNSKAIHQLIVNLTFT